MAAEIANVNEGHFCTEHRRSPFHKGSYGQREDEKSTGNSMRRII